MGLDTVVVAFFVVIIFLAIAGTLTIGTNNLVESCYKGYTSMFQSTMDRLHTNIEITNPRFDGARHHVYFTVKNTGETKLSNFNLWDIIIVKNNHASYLAKEDDYKIEFSNDIMNPGILDPHESIEIELLSEFNYDESVLIKINTENGISSSVYYIAGE